jgi:tRNA threonylcarbamoyladenosine biosynthesis protein TsaB
VLVLALDTTTRAGSVAVVRNGEIVSERIGDGSRTHGERLPLDLMRTLDAASVDVSDVDLLAVAAGPGSFTGLRVGIAAMQGVAMGMDRRIVPVSTLDALARAAVRDDDRRPIGVWMDAQRGEVFASLYEPGGERLIVEASALPPDRTLDHWAESTAVHVRFIGDGAVRYADLIRGSAGQDVDIMPPPALAGIIGRIAYEAPDRARLPHAIVPIYIRRPDAELAREKQRR